MKKTILSIMMALSFNAFSQAVQIWDADPNLSMPNPINVGDSSYIGLNYTMYTADSFLVYIIKSNLPDNGLDTCSNRVPLHTYRLNQISSLPMYHVPPNNYQAFKMGFKVPNVTPFNYYALKIHTYGSCMFDCTTPGTLCIVDFTISAASGIEQYSQPNELISTSYYNLLGQPINEPNGLTIEVKTYQNGSTQVRKIIKTN
jgi:hypothetical protein